MSEWGVAVLGDRLVELVVLVFFDLARLAHPDRLQVVDELPIPGGLLNLLRLRLLLLDVFDLSVIIALGRLLLWFLLDRLLNGFSLALPEVDAEVDELAVLVDEVLERVGFEEVVGLFLEVESDGGTALEGVAAGVFGDGEGAGVGLPDVLGVIVVLGGNDDAVGDEEGGIEADTELTDQILLLFGGRVHEFREEL